MLKDYTAKIAKADLEHGAYYSGNCRNGSEARWNGERQCFVYWRTKFSHTFLEEIRHPEDDNVFDVFVVESKLETPSKEIPFDT